MSINDSTNIEESIDTTNIETQNATEIINKKEYKPFIYIGPSLANGILKSNTILQGDLEEITKYLSGAIEEYPQLKALIVPVSKLAEQKRKVKTPGNILYKYYSDIVSTMKLNNKEE